MNSAKKLICVATLALLSATPLYAAKITSAETGTLATVASLDKSEIMLSIIATNKKTTSGVTDYAKMMIEMHGSNLTQIFEMANTLHAQSLNSSEAEKIKNQTTKDMFKLSALQGAEFDKAYINGMVAGHQGALDLIDKHLMKTAKSEEIKQFLTDTRAVVVQHLDDAKKLQTEMNS